MMQERPMPEERRAFALMKMACVGSMLLAFLVMSYFGKPWVTACSVVFILVVGFYAIRSHFYQRKCPKCGELLALRQDYIPGTARFRCLLDCVHCGIAWDTGHIGDDSAGA